jgi:hypothetical protein
VGLDNTIYLRVLYRCVNCCYSTVTLFIIPTSLRDGIIQFVYGYLYGCVNCCYSTVTYLLFLHRCVMGLYNLDSFLVGRDLHMDALTVVTASFVIEATIILSSSKKNSQCLNSRRGRDYSRSAYSK